MLSRSNIVKQQFSRNGGGTNISNLSQQILNDVVVYLPPMLEQKKIAQILSTWDQAITTTEQLLANSQQQKKALMQQLLTGKKRLHDHNGQPFTEEWEDIAVGKILKPKSEKLGTKNYPIFSVTKNGLIDQAVYFNKTVASDDIRGYKVVNRGEFVMSGLNFWMGAVDVHLDKKSVAVSPAYKTYSIAENFDKTYIKFFVSSSVFKRVLEGSSLLGASVVRRNFSSEIFNSWKLAVPSIEEQQTIAAVIFTADQEINILKQKLNHLKKEKKALMQQLLTGKKRVST